MKLKEKANNHNKTLVLVGIPLRGKADPHKYSDRKYYIKIDTQLLYKRVHLRTLNDICKKLFQNKNVIE